uniref:DNA-directed RNA polymerase n=1 Tax=Leucocytozoon caulleryi TaxID=211597 RepID=U3TLW9_LEUCU|nr:DNA-directed RNA polymerase subunit C2 partA [Leucocytozoon caulleryi]BAN94690.1 DNA-directed RNA polymerase subunit C2 partA [Leucocytozoon caulleryi]
MYFYFLNKSKLKILETKLLSLFKYNISSKILHELLYLGYEYSFLYNYSLNIQDFSNFIYLLILYKCKINNIYNNKYYEIHVDYINLFLNNYYYLKIFNKIQTILNINLYYKINPIYSNLHFFFKNKLKLKYSQLQQLIGFKGYISNIQGIIYDKPIINNYINELNIYEYILSCYGSKKGVIDTALKTADSGYLTKRLANITNNFIIKELNCYSPYLFKYSIIMDIYGNILFPLNILNFKILKNNILNIYTGNLIYSKNIYITKYILNYLLTFNYKNYIYLYVKSLYTCILLNNICNTCLNYIHLYKYNIGQNIGILASTAISEPSTQMVLRTFHVSSVLKTKLNNNLYNNYFIYTYNLYKFKNIKKIFKLIFNCINNKYINVKFNIIFNINKLLVYKNKYNNIINKYNYYIYNQIISYNYINNSMIKNIKYNYFKFNNMIKYINNIYKYYYNNIIQLLVKNIYNKWILYNLYTCYLYYNYIKLYNLNNKGIIYNLNLFKKYNLLYLITNYNNIFSYYYIIKNIYYNIYISANLCIKNYYNFIKL